MKNNKIERVLEIYTKLINGYLINKTKEAQNYGVDERSILRDINTIRVFLESNIEDSNCLNSVIYDRIDKGYRLKQIYKSKPAIYEWKQKIYKINRGGYLMFNSNLRKEALVIHESNVKRYNIW